MTERTELPERFWTKVNKTETCWLWTGHVMRNGYGQASVGRRVELAHRVSFRHLVGPIGERASTQHTYRP